MNFCNSLHIRFRKARPYLFLLSIQAILILTSKITLYPEMFVLPWLTGKGLLPYRDFFDHHGPLTYFLLAPLALDKSLMTIRGFYLLVQSINLIMVYRLCQKSGFDGKLSAFVSLLFLGINFYLSENIFWFEHFLMFFALVGTLFWVKSEFKLNSSKSVFALGVSFLMATLIKPNAGIFTFVFTVVTKKWLPVWITSGGWFGVWGFFAVNDGWKPMVDNLFLFNIKYPHLLSKYQNPPDLTRIPLVLLAAFATISAYFLIRFKYINKIWPQLNIFAMAAAGLLLVYPKFEKISFLPATPFILITLSSLLFSKSKIFYRSTVFFLIILSLLTPFYVYKTIAQIKQSGGYPDNTLNENLISAIHNIGNQKQPIYIYGNNIEIYYYLNIMPPTKYIIIFPWIYDYFPTLDTQIISDLTARDIQTIVISKNQNSINFPTQIPNFIRKNYTLSESLPLFDIYLKKQFAGLQERYKNP